MSATTQAHQLQNNHLIEQARPFLGVVERFIADKDAYIRLLVAALPNHTGLIDVFHPERTGNYFSKNYGIAYGASGRNTLISARCVLPVDNRKQDMCGVRFDISFHHNATTLDFERINCSTWRQMNPYRQLEAPQEGTAYNGFPDSISWINLANGNQPQIVLREWLDESFGKCFPHYVPVVPGAPANTPDAHLR